MDKNEHDLDLSEIDEVDEISGDEQLKRVWCDTHKTYEWHWLPRSASQRRKKIARRNGRPA